MKLTVKYLEVFSLQEEFFFNKKSTTEFHQGIAEGHLHYTTPHLMEMLW